MNSSENPPQKMDSVENSPKKSDSSENQLSGSSENPPKTSGPSENPQTDSSEIRPPEFQKNQRSDSSEGPPKNSDSSVIRPLNPLRKDSSEIRPPEFSRDQPSNSSEDHPKNGDSSVIRPLDPLGLNPLAKLKAIKDRHLSEEFPPWLELHSRRLLARRNIIRANAVVAKDGSGKFKTIAQALAMVPQNNKRKFVIHIKQGVYKEKVEVTKKMLNVMFVGDGPTKTIITGDIAFLPDRIGTYRTATVGKLYNISNFLVFHFKTHRQ